MCETGLVGGWVSKNANIIKMEHLKLNLPHLCSSCLCRLEALVEDSWCQSGRTLPGAVKPFPYWACVEEKNVLRYLACVGGKRFMLLGLCRGETFYVIGPVKRGNVLRYCASVRCCTTLYNLWNELYCCVIIYKYKNKPINRGVYAHSLMC